MLLWTKNNVNVWTKNNVNIDNKNICLYNLNYAKIINLK